MILKDRYYVKTDRDQYFIYVKDPESKFGFYLADDDQSWNGGHGIANEWHRVKASEVPRSVRNRLGWILRGD